MSGYECENRNVLGCCLKLRVTALLWREPAGWSIPRRRKLWMCDCRLWINEWSVRASDQSRTNAVVIVVACLPREWSVTGSNSVQRREWLDMLKLYSTWLCILSLQFCILRSGKYGREVREAIVSNSLAGHLFTLHQHHPRISWRHKSQTELEGRSKCHVLG